MLNQPEGDSINVNLEREGERIVAGPIVLSKDGGDGSEEVAALLGAKVLDVHLFQHVLSRYSCVDTGNLCCFQSIADNNFCPGRLTAMRSRLASNQTLAAIAQRFCVPDHVSLTDWQSFSDLKRATTLKALIGRAFLRSGGDGNTRIHSLLLNSFVRRILDAILYFDIMNPDNPSPKPHPRQAVKSSKVSKAVGKYLNCDRQSNLSTLALQKVGSNRCLHVYTWLSKHLQFSNPSSCIQLARVRKSWKASISISKHPISLSVVSKPLATKKTAKEDLIGRVFKLLPSMDKELAAYNKSKT